MSHDWSGEPSWVDCGRGGLEQGRGFGVGHVNDLHVVVEAVRGHRVRLVGYVGNAHVVGLAWSGGDGCDLDGRFGVGHVDDLHSIVKTAGDHRVHPAGYLVDFKGHIVGPAQPSESTGVGRNGGERDRNRKFGVGHVDDQHVVIKTAGDHRVSPAVRLGYIHTASPVQFDKAVSI